MYNRIHIIVLDSVGIGAAADAADFGDSGAHTLGHIAATQNLQLPHLAALGLGTLAELPQISPNAHRQGYATTLSEHSVGKDTMTGHWELMGVVSQTPFRVFPQGFPEELLTAIRVYSGREVLCNLPYSGTDVIADYGEEHLATGALIVYTSADPVLQIAAHEAVVPLAELYDICRYVREITLQEPYTIGRIIARPFNGSCGQFQRTSNRHDYALKPWRPTVLAALQEAGHEVVAVGKISDIFDGEGITRSVRTVSNMDGVDRLLAVLAEDFHGISMTNLVDFDALFGHRRDPAGYAAALTAFDQRLPELLAALSENDLLLITADHGNDPTFPGTDHTREIVPLLAYSPSLTGQGVLPPRAFADVAATVAANFDVKQPESGDSFLHKLR